MKLPPETKIFAAIGLAFLLAGTAATFVFRSATAPAGLMAFVYGGIPLVLVSGLFIVALLDVRSRRREALQFRENEELTARLLESSFDCVAVLELNGKMS